MTGCGEVAERKSRRRFESLKEDDLEKEYRSALVGLFRFISEHPEKAGRDTAEMLRAMKEWNATKSEDTDDGFDNA